jgi:hypothetical protein
VSRLAFTVVDAAPDRLSLVPRLVFRLRITESTGERVHAMVLRARVEIDARRRRYDAAERARLSELFGTPDQWGHTLRALPWADAAVVVPDFEGAVVVDVPVAVTYDTEVAAAKYLHRVEGEIPLVFLFTGTVFTHGATGFAVERLSWESEATFRLPQSVWRELADMHFPGAAWIRLRRDTFDDLCRFKAAGALPTWDAAMRALLGAQEAGTASRSS